MLADHVVMNQPRGGCLPGRIKIKNRLRVQQAPSGQVDYYQTQSWFNAATISRPQVALDALAPW
jgi:hypothetical protein